MLKTKLEKSIEGAVVKWARRNGITVTKLNLMGNRGWPDRCFWLEGGRPLLIEFKRKGERPRRLQEHIIQQLRKLGYNVETCDNYEDAIRTICRAMASKTPS